MIRLSRLEPYVQGVKPIICVPVPFWLMWLLWTVLESIPFLGLGTLRFGDLNR
jgi:hypothetical protein